MKWPRKELKIGFGHYKEVRFGEGHERNGRFFFMRPNKELSLFLDLFLLHCWRGTLTTTPTDTLEAVAEL